MDFAEHFHFIPAQDSPNKDPVRYNPRFLLPGVGFKEIPVRGQSAEAVTVSHGLFLPFYLALTPDGIWPLIQFPVRSLFANPVREWNQGGVKAGTQTQLAAGSGSDMGFIHQIANPGFDPFTQGNLPFMLHIERKQASLPDAQQFVGGHPSSSSGIPAREVQTDATAASAAVPSTTFQSTSVIIAVAGSSATIVCAKVLPARIPAHFSHFCQFLIVPSFPADMRPANKMRQDLSCPGFKVLLVSITAATDLPRYNGHSCAAWLMCFSILSIASSTGPSQPCSLRPFRQASTP